MDKIVANQIELLKRYYALDEKKKIFDVVLHYKKASDLFDEDVESISLPKMKDDIVQKISNIAEDIPHGYKADISLVIDDYEGYKKEDIISSFNDVIYCNRYRFNRENTNKWFKVAFLILVGVMLLFFNSLATVKGYWGVFTNEEVLEEVIHSITEITGWVFIWEAVSLAFLKGSEIFRTGATIYKKINYFALYEGDSEKALLKETAKDITKEMIGEGASRRVGLLLLMFAGFAVIGVALSRMMIDLSAFDPSNSFAVPLLIGSILGLIVKIATGCFAVLLYKGKEQFKIPVLVVAILDFIIVIFTIVALSLDGISVSDWMSFISSIVVNGLYIVGFILFAIGDYKQKRKQ